MDKAWNTEYELQKVYEKKKALELFLTDNRWTKKRNPAFTNGNWRKQFNEPIGTM